MKNFIFKSSDADLQKMFSILENLQKNILYITYRVDGLLKKVNSLETMFGLKKQTDDYYEERPTHPEDEDKEPD